jgi:uncharacterized protein YjbI with pentapeptide repeats
MSVFDNNKMTINNAFHNIANSDSDSDSDLDLDFDFNNINYLPILSDTEKKRNKWRLKRQSITFIESMEPNNTQNDLCLKEANKLFQKFFKIVKYKNVIDLNELDEDSITEIFKLLESKEIKNIHFIEITEKLKQILTGLKTKIKKKGNLIETSQKKECREIKLCKQILQKNGPYDSLNENQKNLLLKCKTVKELLIVLIEYKLLHDLDNLELHDLNLSYIDFYNNDNTNVLTEIKDTNFSGSNLSRSNFTNIVFSNVIMEDINAVYAVFSNCVFYNIDFIDSNFSGTSLCFSVFNNVKFNKFKFNKIDASSSKFIESEFKNTQFIEAHCSKLSVMRTLFRNCTFGADKNTTFDASQFKNVIFDGGSIIGTNFCNSVHLHGKFIDLIVNKNDFKNVIFINTIEPEFI